MLHFNTGKRRSEVQYFVLCVRSSGESNIFKSSISWPDIYNMKIWKHMWHLEPNLGPAWLSSEGDPPRPRHRHIALLWLKRNTNFLWTVYDQFFCLWPGLYKVLQNNFKGPMVVTKKHPADLRVALI